MTDDKIIDRVYGKYTKATRERLKYMINACRQVDKMGIEGDIVECGVWRGGHIMLARIVSPDRRCWLYDTFTGMPRPEKHRDVKMADKGRPAIDTWKAKNANGHRWAAASLEEVHGYFSQEELMVPSKLVFVEGQVETTLKDPAKRPDKIAILRLDTDWHSSTKAELEYLYPRLVTGGILIVDDYGHWRGCREAVQEYFKKKGINYAGRLTPIDYTAVTMVKE